MFSISAITPAGTWSPAPRRSDGAVPRVQSAAQDAGMAASDGVPASDSLPPASNREWEPIWKTSEATTEADGTGQTTGDDVGQGRESAQQAAPGDHSSTKAERADKKKGRDGLTPEQEREVTKLQQRDREVRAHEAAHQAAGGGLTGGASFSYETGPDGRSYAVGGEVPVDLSAGRTPEETIARAQRVRAAAMAPADPSAADMSVAAAASELEANARRQQSLERAASMAASLPRPTRSHAKADAAALPSTEPKLESEPVDVNFDASLVYATLECQRLAEPVSAVRLASQSARARMAYGP